MQQPLSSIHKVLFLASKSIQGKRDPNRKFLHVTLAIAHSCQNCRNQPGAALPSQIGIQERTPPTAPYCRCAGLLPRHSRTCAHCSGAMLLQNIRTTACCINGSACSICRFLGSIQNHLKMTRKQTIKRNAFYNIFAVST